MTIKEWLFENKKTQTELAKMIGVCDGYISKIKNNQIRPNHNVKIALEKLGIETNTMSNAEIKTIKNEKIKALLRENKELKEKIKVLENYIIINIENALNTSIHQYKVHRKATINKRPNRK